MAGELPPVTFAASSAPTALDRRDDEAYREVIEDALLVHELGFAGLWLAEHAFSDYMPHPSPLLTMAHVAALVPDLSLGVAVLVLPWYNPLRLAGEIAMLSAMTRGELLLGVGRSTSRREYESYQVPMEHSRERYEESFRILELALTGDPFRFEGRHYRYERPVRIRPAPSPGTAIRFFGAVGSPSGAAHVAELGLAPLFHSQLTHGELETSLDRVRRASSRSGRAPAEPAVIQVRLLLADSDAEARDMALSYYPRGFAVQHDHYLHDPAHHGLAELTRPEGLEPFLARQLVGSPDTVARVLRRYLELGFGHVILHTSVPGMPQAVRHDSYRRFARDVAPRFVSSRRPGA